MAGARVVAGTAWVVGCGALSPVVLVGGGWVRGWQGGPLLLLSVVACLVALVVRCGLLRRSCWWSAGWSAAVVRGGCVLGCLGCPLWFCRCLATCCRARADPLARSSAIWEKWPLTRPTEPRSLGWAGLGRSVGVPTRSPLGGFARCGSCRTVFHSGGSGVGPGDTGWVRRTVQRVGCWRCSRLLEISAWLAGWPGTAQEVGSCTGATGR